MSPMLQTDWQTDYN